VHRGRCLHSQTGERAVWTSCRGSGGCKGSGGCRGSGECGGNGSDDDDDSGGNDNDNDNFFDIIVLCKMTSSPIIIIHHILLQLIKWYLGAESASFPPSILPPLTPPVSKRLGDPIGWAWDSRE
jgi:hypothetical protein